MPCRLNTPALAALHILLTSIACAYTPIVIKKVTSLGPQLTPDVIDVSRDGGYSALINGNSVWHYDDTECVDAEGSQLSFVSNTAAYATQPTKNVTTVTDFGVVSVGKEKDGSPKNAILADTTVGTGGWVPFQPDELEFNQQMNGKERVAIFYVDMKPQDPSKEYQGRGMILITITAPPSGPVATRQGDLIIPGTEVGFGGFTTLLGRRSTDSNSDKDDGDRDLYLLGVTNSGLQLARVGINDLNDFSKFTFWEPDNLKFTKTPPKRGLIENQQIYMPGTFSSGSVFFSPYFNTFIMVYFNKMVDSTFYIRYLDLKSPLTDDKVWISGGKHGKDIEAEDAEALVRYSWSAQQKLYASSPGKGGFNYAGSPHPEFFNRQYFPQSLYPDDTPTKQRFNDWYGSSLVSEDEAGSDGKYLLLSWTSQKVGGMDKGIYEIQLALVEFDDIPANPDATAPAPTTSSSKTFPTKATETMNPHDAVSSIFHKIKTGSASTLSTRPMFQLWAYAAVLLVLGMYIIGSTFLMR
ncbi:MAG: hypothetical protein Q9217_001348 [Psora testacea]